MSSDSFFKGYEQDYQEVHVANHNNNSGGEYNEARHCTTKNTGWRYLNLFDLIIRKTETNNKKGV
jgi:hypothetical protein